MPIQMRDANRSYMRKSQNRITPPVIYSVAKDFKINRKNERLGLPRQLIA